MAHRSKSIRKTVRVEESGDGRWGNIGQQQGADVAVATSMMVVRWGERFQRMAVASTYVTDAGHSSSRYKDMQTAHD